MKAVFAGLMMGWGAAMAGGPEPGTWDRSVVCLESLLGEMLDRESVARWPEPAFTCSQASSHDRSKVAPDQPGWFSNNDQGQYIRDEENQGRRERVMMDAAGPGCIVRFWLTTDRNKKGTLRIYLDGDPAPALTFPAYDLLSGELKVDAPLAQPHPGYLADQGGGNTLYLPIPYAKRCKVTWEEADTGPRYYHINYRTYAAGTPVRTFTRAALEPARPLIRRVNQQLSASPEPTPDRILSLDEAVPAGGKASLALPEGPAAVRTLEFRLRVDAPAQLERALRAVIVQMQFDGEDAVWCPASDFFGSGVGVNALSNWYRTVDSDGRMRCRWVMPYAKSGRITLTNTGGIPVHAELRAGCGPWRWDDRSMHFHCAWHYEAGLDTPPLRDWNYIRIAGRGVYVGDNLALFNPVATWYGEGNEKIWVDGEAFPSHLGTGTEDYYNFSFAPKPVHQTPFSSQVRMDQEMTQGHNVLTRTRNLDVIPFGKSLQFDIELISWKPMRLVYAATTYWYAFRGGSSNVQPQPREAALPVPTQAEASAAQAAGTDKMPEYRSPIRFTPSKRAVGDVMPFYWKGEYHVFYLTNPTGNDDVNWEHIVSKDLVTWKELPPALTPDKNAPNGPEGGCMFTGCIVEKEGVFHAWYTSWNPDNPAGREYLSHATSKDLIQWTKHPEHMIAPDGIHYANHHDRDFRDPQIFWNEKAKEYWMHINGNVPGKEGFRFGLLTSKDLVHWLQQNPVEGVPGDECPDYFRIGDTHYIHSCRMYCYSDRLEGPYKYPELTREIDIPCIIAAKRCWDGKRHVWFGGWQTGGPMAIPREVYAGPNGLLYMKPVAEVVNVFKHTALDLSDKPEITQSGAQWRYDGPVLRSSAGREKAKAVFSVPEHYMLDCLVAMTPKSRFTITIGGHYHLCLTPETAQLSLTGPEFNRSRPCPVDTSKPVRIQVFAEGKLIECFVNDQFAQTCTVGTAKEKQLEVGAEGGSVGILKLLVKTCR